MATCTECGAVLTAQDAECPSCGQAAEDASAPDGATAVNAPAASAEVAPAAGEVATGEEEPSLFSVIVGVIGWLVIFFLGAVVIITFYAAVAAASLAMGVPLNGGIAIATVLLLLIGGLGAWFYVKRKRR